MIDDIWSCDQTRSCFPALADALPQGHDHMGLVTIGRRLYAVGGRFNTFEFNTNLLDVYNPAMDTWSSLKPMRRRAAARAVAVLDGKMASGWAARSIKPKPTTRLPTSGPN